MSESEEEVTLKPNGKVQKIEPQSSKSTRGKSSRDVEMRSDASREWDENCYICEDGGNMLCCEGCSKVAHVKCLKLKKAPKDDWYCNDCQQSADESKEWDEMCYVCEDGGDVMCCEECTKVAHAKCAGLR